MPLSEDTLAHVAATLAAGIISQRAPVDTPDGAAKEAVQVFNGMLRKLRAQHGDLTAPETVANAKAAVQRNTTLGSDE